MFPAVEKSLSDGVDVAGILITALASCAKFGNLGSLIFHHSKMLVLRTHTFFIKVGLHFIFNSSSICVIFKISYVDGLAFFAIGGSCELLLWVISESAIVQSISPTTLSTFDITTSLIFSFNDSSNCFKSVKQGSNAIDNNRTGESWSVSHYLSIAVHLKIWTTGESFRSAWRFSASPNTTGKTVDKEIFSSSLKYVVAVWIFWSDGNNSSASDHCALLRSSARSDFLVIYHFHHWEQ